jgi:DNA-binding response OmpR family regulator
MPRKVLFVDDDQGIREVISIILEESGYQIITIDQDKDIEETILRECPEVILLDIWISGHDGRTILKRIKSNPKTAHLPVIMISAKNDGEVVAKEAGADDFIAKPFEMEELLSKIEKYLPELATA